MALWFGARGPQKIDRAAARTLDLYLNHLALGQQALASAAADSVFFHELQAFS